MAVHISRKPVPGAYWVVDGHTAAARILDFQPSTPICALTGEPRGARLPCVRFDEVSFGQHAAHHLHDCGHQAVIAVNTGNSDRLKRRCQSFIAEAQRLGMHATYLRTNDYEHEADFCALPSHYNHTAAIGIYTPNDAIADWLSLADKRMPYSRTIRLIDALNTIKRCLAVEPELSSIAVPWQMVGAAVDTFCCVTQGTTQPQRTNPPYGYSSSRFIYPRCQR